MSQEGSKDQSAGAKERSMTRNPFGVIDVPDPNGPDVADFAAKTDIKGSADDANARAWESGGSDSDNESLEGKWCSRWNGGQDPTIPGDSKEQWKQGKGDVQAVGDRVYLSFDWDNGVRKGLIDARREGNAKLVGRYINVTSPTITRPWVGLIVNSRRIDGQFPEGRLDFRR